MLVTKTLVYIFALLLLSQLAAADSTAPDVAAGDCAEVLTPNAPQIGNRRVILESPERGGGVSFKGNVFRGIVAEPIVELNTMRFRDASGFVQPDSQVLMPMLHGLGADTSHSGAMLGALNMMLTRRTNKQKGITAQIHNNFPYVRVAAWALDLPGNGFGPSLNHFLHVDKLVDWLAAEFINMRARAPHLPLVPFCRSASTGIMVELNRRYPDLLDGMILMSPMTPEPVALKASMDGFRDDVAHIRKLEAQGIRAPFIPNVPVVEWAEALYQQMSWHNEKNILQGKPVLVLVGSKDLQTPQIVRNQYRQFIEGNPNAEVLEVEGAGHDVISILPPNSELGIKGYGAIYKFLDKIAAKR